MSATTIRTIETFDIAMVFPAGPLGKASARASLTMAAKSEIVVRIRALGHEPVLDSVRVSWMPDGINGVVSAEAWVEREIPAE